MREVDESTRLPCWTGVVRQRMLELISTTQLSPFGSAKKSSTSVPEIVNPAGRYVKAMSPPNIDEVYQEAGDRPGDVELTLKQ